MKKFIFTLFALVAFSFLSLNAQEKKSSVSEKQKTEYSVNGKEVTTNKSATTKTVDEGIDTGYTYKDSKGNSYKIMKTKNDKYFVWKTSQKTGNRYKQYLNDLVLK